MRSIIIILYQKRTTSAKNGKYSANICEFDAKFNKHTKYLSAKKVEWTVTCKSRKNTTERDTVANLGVCLYVALYYNLVREKNIYDPQNV